VLLCNGPIGVLAPDWGMWYPDHMKEVVGRYIAEKVKNGSVIGIGSGTTVEVALRLIGERIAKEGLKVKGVSTSFKAESIARESGIEVYPLYSGIVPDFAFDGADEVDPDWNLIKGRGAAITREKILARRAGGLSVIVTEEKLVTKLGSKFPVPIEVIPDAYPDLVSALKTFSPREVVLREGSGKYGPVVTEHGNFLVDVSFSEGVPANFEDSVNLLPGVVECGVFSRDTKEVIVSKGSSLFRFEKGGNLVQI